MYSISNLMCYMLCNTDNLTLLKYADDMTLVAHLTNAVTKCVTGLIKWFNDSHLLLNETKTREICLNGNRKHEGNTLFKTNTIKGQEVEQVSTFKYLRTVLDLSFTFSGHVEIIHKKHSKDSSCYVSYVTLRSATVL